MNKAFSFFQIHKMLSVLIILCAVFSLATLVVISINYGHIPSSIVTKFDKSKEITTFAGKNILWGIWLLGLSISLVNGFLLYEFWQRERILSYIIASASAIISALIFLIVIVLISNN